MGAMNACCRLARSLVLSACALGAAAADRPVLSSADRPFSFAVLGDLHYARPAFAQRPIAAGIAASLRGVDPAPAFVCQTGDLVLGEADGHKQLDRAGVCEELAFAVSDLTSAFGLPLFVAVGNHDKHAGGAPYRETVLPLLARELGAPLDRAYYAFRHGNACFVFLDYGDYSKAGTNMDYAAQGRFLEETLAQAKADPAVRHIFAFGHYPLWPVARPGFSSDRFTDSVVPAFERHPIDAYFCGHTHNTGAWVRRVGGAPVTQIKGVALDHADPLAPMEETRTPLIPRRELSYGWGYLSGPTNGHFWVAVEGPRVRVQLRSGPAVIREFAWQEPGAVVDVLAPPAAAKPAVTAAALRRAVRAEIVFTPWTERPAELVFRLNGERIGDAQLEAMPHWAAFAGEKRVQIPAAAIKGLRLENEVVIENPGRALFGVGNVRLDVRLADGTTARTAVFGRFLLSARQAEAAAQHGSTLGWEIIPDGVRTTVALGQPLGPARLVFP